MTLLGILIRFLLKKILVMASGHGTNLRAIIYAIKERRLSAEISTVISENPDCGAVDIARRNEIPVRVIPYDRNNRDRFFREVYESIKSSIPDLVVLAGFMKILPPWLVDEMPERMINLHPALLPCFGGKGYYGKKVHQAVLESGARITGCTVHFVTSDVDSGPIIVQRSMTVNDRDTAETLADRLSVLEHESIIEAISLILSGNYRIEGRRVIRENRS